MTWDYSFPLTARQKWASIEFVLDPQFRCDKMSWNLEGAMDLRD